MDNEDFKIIPATDEPRPIEVAPVSRSGKKRIIFLVTLLSLCLAVLAYKILISSPKTFPIETVVVIEEGETLSGSAQLLADRNMIRSEFAFKLAMMWFGGSKGLHVGEYYFDTPENVIKIAQRLSRSEFNLQNIKITIPEGLRVTEIAELFAKESAFKYFDKKEFLKLAEKHEGYLFPDTYLFLPIVRAENIIDGMRANYDKQIQTIKEDLDVFDRPIEDVIIMASILEEEGRMEETRRVIADILWKRLDEKIPLQVDASIVYLTGKSDGNKLAQDDFKIESSYNTYMKLGLPPTPISNPGLAAIRAAITPIKTKYYFYLTDPDGGFHPAATYDSHLINKAKYLDS